MASHFTIVKLGLAAAFLCVAMGGGWGAEAAVSCSQVMGNLTPCVSYVVNGGAVPPSCCNGVKNLNGLAHTTDDRQAVCRCLLSLIKGVQYNDKNVANAAALPGKCNVNLPYTISPHVDCNTITK